MGRLEKNIFANLAGVAWSAILGVLCIPLYITLMGVEAFGLVGIFVTLQSIFVVLDLGVSATLCREVARLANEDQNAREQRDLVFTLQFIHWSIAITVGATVFLLAPVIAHHWVTPESLSESEVTGCIRLMGAAMALQFPFSFYQGGLLGLQRQLLFNAISTSVATGRALGTLLALHFISPAPEVFFVSQAAAGAVGTVTIATAFWRVIPVGGGGGARFRPVLIRRVWLFSAAYATNSLANLGLFQMDKIILSKLLTLEMFGYYALAKGIVSGVYALIIAVDGAIFPRFSELVARGADAELSRVYHRSCQLMSVLIMPVTITTAVFSREALFVWTGDPTIVENAHTILTLLMIGMLIYGLTQPLYYLQVAYGWWRLITGINLILLPAIIPLFILITQWFGGTGAASVLIFLNIIYLFTLPFMHRRFMRGQQWRWLFEDIGLPLTGASAVGGVASWLFPDGLSRLEIMAYLCAVGLLATATSTLLASRIRAAVLVQIRAKILAFVARCTASREM